MASKIKKDDKVIVLRGKDKGKESKVVRVIPDKGMVYLENINTAKRHTKPSQNHQGGIIDKMMPVNISNVALLCPACKKSTRVGFSILEDKKKVRVCKKCGENIDK